MDKSVFGPFQHYWDEQVLLFYSHSTDSSLSKQRFGKIFTKAWDKAAAPAKVKAGFCATGIYHFNPPVIPDEAFAPSLKTQNEDAQVSNVVTVFQTLAPVPLLQKTHKASSLPGISSRVVPSNSNPDVVYVSRYEEKCHHYTFTRNIRTFIGLNINLISKHFVNSMEISDTRKKKGVTE
jgi:hypothetical protein